MMFTCDLESNVTRELTIENGCENYAYVVEY